MKNAAEYQRRIRRLLSGLRPTTEKTAPPVLDSITDHLILAHLMRHASDSEALAAYRRLRESTVDLNELRVTPVDELEEILGSDFPNARAAAECMTKTLAALFNRCHHLDLSFLADMPRRDARAYLQSLDGMDAFCAALVMSRGLGHPSMPVDERVLEWLRNRNAVPATATAAQAEALLERVVPPAQYEQTLTLLRRAAAPRPGSRAAARRPRRAAAAAGHASSRKRPAPRAGRPARPGSPKRSAPRP